MLTEYLLKNAEDFDKAVQIVKDYESEVVSFNLKQFLKDIIQLSDDEISKKISEKIEKFEKYGYPYGYPKYGYPKYGYPGLSVIEELKAILKSKDIKKAIQDLIDKLAKIKYGYGLPYGYPKPEKVSAEETVNLYGVEIASVGDYTSKGVVLTQEDLKEMVENYNLLKDKIKPPVKIGHFGTGLGLPAVGWVENLRVENDKLVADFMYVPKRISELIKMKAYRRVSPEIYVDYEEDDKKHGKALSAVAILGADIPEIKNLKDLEVLYNSEELEKLDFVYPKDKETENIDTEKENLLKENIKLKVENFIEKSKDKILPVYEDLLKTVLMKSLEVDAKVNFTEDNQEKELSLFDAITEIINRLPKIVEFKEISKEKIDVPISEDELIEKIMAEKGISRTEAIKMLIKENKIKLFTEQT